MLANHSVDFFVFFLPYVIFTLFKTSQTLRFAAEFWTLTSQVYKNSKQAHGHQFVH